MIDYLNSFGIPEKYKKTNGRNIKVAILDAGVEKHNDLVFEKTLNFTSDNTVKSNHGMHISGIISGKRYGLAKEVKLYSCKTINNNLEGNWENLISALEWCLEEKIDIINISLGGFATNEKLHNIIKKAYENNTIIVCASGNNKFGYSLFPANYKETISVIGSTNIMSKYTIKNIDDKIDFIVPCENIYSTALNNKYCKLSGTSMATAFITGITSLILSYEKCNVDELKEIISSISFPIKYIESDSLSNYGLIDFLKLKGE